MNNQLDFNKKRLSGYAVYSTSHILQYGFREETIHPVAGMDNLRTFQEFDDWLDIEDKCLQYIAKLRWPHGFRCPADGEKYLKIFL